MRSSNSDFFPCDYTKACHVLYVVQQKGWSQTKAGIAFGLNTGTVNHVVHKRRFQDAVPVEPPDFIS